MNQTTSAATALMISLALGGCVATSVRGMRERPAVLTADSTRTPGEISQCVTDAWVRLGHTPRTLPREHGTTLLVEQVITYALPIMMMDMDATPSGTHVSMRLFKSLSAKQNQRRIDEVRACL